MFDAFFGRSVGSLVGTSVGLSTLRSVLWSVGRFFGRFFGRSVVSSVGSAAGRSILRSVRSWVSSPKSKVQRVGRGGGFSTRQAPESRPQGAGRREHGTRSKEGARKEHQLGGRSREQGARNEEQRSTNKPQVQGEQGAETKGKEPRAEKGARSGDWGGEQNKSKAKGCKESGNGKGDVKSMGNDTTTQMRKWTHARPWSWSRARWGL